MLDRKTWTVLLLCGGVLAANIYYKGKLARDDAQREAAREQVEPAGGDGEPPEPDRTASGGDGETVGNQGEVESGSAQPDPPKPAQEEQTVFLRTPEAVFEFSTHGGGISTVDVLGQHAVGTEEVDVMLNRAAKRGVGALTKGTDLFVDEYYQLVSSDAQSVVFAAEVEAGILIRKKWSLLESKDEGMGYRVELELSVENQGEKSVELSDYGLFLGTAAPLYKREWENQTGLFYLEGQDFEFEAVTWFKKGWFREARPLFSREIGPIGYAGVSNQFFTTIVSPAEAYDGEMWGKVSNVTLPEVAGGGEKKAVRAGISLPKETLGPNGGQKTIKFDVLMGPKWNRMLRRAGGHRGKVMNYGLFSFVSNPLNRALNYIHGVVFSPVSDKWSWGFSIVLLTILIRGLMWPLQNKSTRSMKRMSLVQPEVAALKEKYPDDPQKMNQEMMKLYREYGINPLGGCLPMVVQIPIFFGFYRMLQYAVELRQQEFLWVTDLSQPDTLMTLPVLGGLPINLLPILMAASMVLQMSLTPKTGDKMQQRIFMFMPLMFFFFCYSFASALALYWTTSNIFAIVQTLVTKRLPAPKLKKKAKKKGPGMMERMQSRAEDMQRKKGQGGGGATGGKPKKPKKPRGPRTGG
jgi:YidC/Oxa1 family membrane protein insertase